MKKINDYWIGDNNNKWDIHLYTQKQAQKENKSLINCNYCTDCNFCSYCENCEKYSNCSYKINSIME